VGRFSGGWAAVEGLGGVVGLFHRGFTAIAARLVIPLCF
jgi:hypothetical protein